jgi:hypothetical protein|tara:strand:+ start:355 stop:2448 length:2094 start_codon:yes stop_codon:yes gene_type:complete
MANLWDYVQEYPGLLKEQLLSGIGAFAEDRQPIHLLGALNPAGPLIQDAAVQAGGLIAPQVNALSQSVSQGSENLGHGPLSIPDVTGEQLAPLLMLGTGRMPKGGRITDRIIAPDPVGEMRRKLNRKSDIGATQPRTVLEKDGQKMVVGDITFDDWAERTTKMKPSDIQDYRKWYREGLGEFEATFGKKDAPSYMLGWLLGNQNESPAGAMRNLLRAEDKVRGLLQPFTAGLGEEKILQSLTGADITSGAGPKLMDFVDSAEGKQYRTYMGDDPQGGSPTVMDVHSTRDMGFVDKTFHKWLVENFGDIAKDVKVDVSGGPQVTQYERGSERMNEFAEEANKRGFMGGGWTPSEIQAVGWKYMGDLVGGGVQTIPEAMQSNVRRISTELAFGIGSPLQQEFGGTWDNMPLKDQQWLTDHVARETLPVMMEMVGVRGQANLAGGNYGGVSPPSIQLDALASPERASDMANMVGLLFQQDEVIAGRPLQSGGTLSLDVNLGAGVAMNKGMVFAERLQQLLDVGTWGGRRMGPPTKGGLLATQTAPGFYYVPETGTITLFLDKNPKIKKSGRMGSRIESNEALELRLQEDVVRVLELLGRELKQKSNFTLYNAEANWHGEENHWRQGGTGEVYKRGLGESGRSDLLQRMDDSSQYVRSSLQEGIARLQSGQATRLKRHPIKGRSLLRPIEQATPRGGFLVK